MLECPFEIINCSWPCPLEQDKIGGLFEPEWGAPLMSTVPRSCLEFIHDRWCWIINWSDFFRFDMAHGFAARYMNGFQVLFRIKMKYTGVFLALDDGDTVMRQNGRVLRGSSDTPPPARFTIEVKAGDELEIAQWNREEKEWLWGGLYLSSEQQNAAVAPQPADLLMPYLERVQDRLRHPNGPPLKVFTNGRVPARVIVGVYSLILNGYVPSAIYLFGDHQWRRSERELQKKFLPFAQIVSVGQIIKQIRPVAEPELIERSIKHWFVMKTLVALLYPPDEFCFIDDDVFILGRLDDALAAFQTHDLVFSVNYDHSDEYASTWKHLAEAQSCSPLGKFNAGLYWLRNTKDPRVLAAQMQEVDPATTTPQNWEQGFIAVAYADEHSVALPLSRYYAPAMNGLAGGMFGYDYLHNPCKFASIHFLGVAKPDKPSDGETLLYLAPQLLRDGRGEE